MRHLSAYLLLVLGGNNSPSADDVRASLAAVGVEVDEDRLAKLITDLHGKDLNQLLAQGLGKMSSLGSVSVASSASSSSAPPAAAAKGGSKPAAAVETKPAAEPEPEKKEEEIDLGGGMDMFGGGAAGKKGDY